MSHVYHPGRGFEQLPSRLWRSLRKRQPVLSTKMKSYLLQLGDREEGPYSDTQVGQLFAEHRINQHTPCTTDRFAGWRTVDEYFPTLKYRTELPAVIEKLAPAFSTTPPVPIGSAVKIVDVDVPFASVLKMVFKIFAAWLIVIICFIPLFLIVWLFLFAGLLSFFGSHLPR